MRNLIFVLIASCLSAVICLSAGQAAVKKNVKTVKTEASKPFDLTVMTFNVENLFDTNHDEGKDDYTYLPMSVKKTEAHKDFCGKIEKRKWREDCFYADWNEDILKIKIQRLGEVVKTVNGGQGPDILMVQEVENKGILERFRKEQLETLGFKHSFLIEGKDKRGIDVAAVTKLDVVGEPKLHAIPFKDETDKRLDDTRGILELTVKLPDGKLATFFVVHFPAPFHPVSMRKQAYAFLNTLLAKAPKDHLVVAAGDFNTPSDEDKDTGLLKTFVKPNWTIAHEKCDGCKGTTYFPPKESWSFLDMILMRFPNATSWNLQKVWIANSTAEQKHDDGTPKRFDLEEKSGVSDHWPLVSVLKYAPEPPKTKKP